MTGLYVFGFSEVQQAQDLKRVLGAKTKAALWTYGGSTCLHSHSLVIPAPTPADHWSSVKTSILLRSWCLSKTLPSPCS